MNFQERFYKINKLLGYGNPNANIIYIGIEEYGQWKIENILDNNNFYNIKELIKSKEFQNMSFNDKIKKLKEKGIYREDIEIELDKQINEYYEKLQNYIYPCISNNKFSNTYYFQYELSKLILHNEMYPYEIFGSKQGYEACLNFFPLGRDKTINNYEELFEFFGIKENKKFIQGEIQNRLDYFRKLFIALITKSKKYKIWIYVMGLNKSDIGNSITHQLFQTFADCFNFNFTINDLLNNTKLQYFNFGYNTMFYKYISCNIKICFSPHPNNCRVNEIKRKEVYQKMTI